MPRIAGFSLWELLWTLLIAAIVFGIAVPNFRDIMLDSRRTADINALVLAIQLARSEAAKRGRPAVVCKSADGAHCGGAGIRFDAGWIVFVNEDNEQPPDRSSTEPLLYAHVPELTGTITANRPLFEFRPFRRRSTNGTIVFCDRRGPSAARALIVSYTGRPRVSAVSADGETLPCAGLP